MQKLVEKTKHKVSNLFFNFWANFSLDHPANTYLFKVNNRKTRHTYDLHMNILIMFILGRVHTRHGITNLNELEP